MEAPYRFRVLDTYNYTYDTPELWQAWHEAYFRRISSVLGANGEWVRLKDDGCTMPEYKTPNCTRTCSNATSMFYSESNVWNCIALATVSIQVLQGNKSFDEENVVSMDQRFNLGGSDFRAIDQLGIFAQFEPYRSQPINAGNILDFANIINGPYCRNTSLGIDPDIAGPGIIVSYMMLLALVFLLSLFFCLHRLFPTKARKRTTESLFCLSGLCPIKAKKEAAESSDSWQCPCSKPRSEAESLIANSQETVKSDSSQCSCSKPQSKVESLIVNLQEAQGSFVFTVSLIYLIAFDRNTIGLSNIGTLLSFSINRDIGYGLMIIGTFSVAALHYFAWKSGMHWLKSLAFVLSNMSMLARAHHIYNKDSWANPETFLDSLRENAALEKCGNNPGPMSFCLGARLQGLTETQQTFTLTRRMVYAVYFLCILLLVEDGIMRFLSNRRRDTLMHRWGLVVYHTLVLARFAPLAIGISDLKATLKWIDGDKQPWSFGQFVAVSVWGPLGLKLIGAFLSMFGAWEHVKNACIDSRMVQRANEYLDNRPSQKSTSGGIEGCHDPLPDSPGVSVADSGGRNGSNSSNEALQGSGLPLTQPARTI
ncbi:hypothetical protein FMUND_12195 [Fusarium mundagurra]|uniref:Uncharacterized protein n=1 Tax=Fusarium mundagurra TaxID=1567541 RepID=A0A8H5Y3U8_9HYPO|nr:hypothetical protein FMUND_12195 [Fusarium mundagurra]